MHPEAMAWVAAFATDEPVSVLDIGGRNINGSPRHLFPNATTYRTLDILDGEGIDIVADASNWEPDQAYDVVLCLEVFEHAKFWGDIISTARKALAPGGIFVATTAGPGRALHSGVDGGPVLHEGEHYGNVEPDAMRKALWLSGFRGETIVHENLTSHDVRCAARPARLI
jgi:2-polyprenyl-3-methyl-5-hydroxy-6-metoxy-1,4-benzoquinol methylase